jgi:hypothetical protein
MHRQRWFVEKDEAILEDCCLYCAARKSLYSKIALLRELRCYTIYARLRQGAHVGLLSILGMRHAQLQGSVSSSSVLLKQRLSTQPQDQEFEVALE